MSASRIAFTAASTVIYDALEVPAPGPGEVVVRSQRTLLSTGTETIVFSRRFDPGTHWDNWVKYPFFPGYACIGTITAVGPEVTNVSVGQRVACRKGHASHHLLEAQNCFPVPEGVSDEAASWFALAKIAFMGARAAAPLIGDDVLIVGAGPVGQMAIRWMRALGCQRVIVVDPVAQRLEHARAGGATHTIDTGIDQAKDAIRAACGGKAPRLAIDSTGNAKVFASVLGHVADRGRVVILGDTGSPTSQNLTSDVITRGLSIVGAHDCHTDAQWTDATITSYLFNLAANGRFPLENLVTHRFAPDQCVAAYDLAANHREKTMGIAFDWTGDLPQPTSNVASLLAAGPAKPDTAR